VPRVEGDGAFGRVAIPPPRGTLHSFLSADGETLFLKTTGPHGSLLCCMDLDLYGHHLEFDSSDCLAPGPHHLLSHEPSFGFRLLTLPDLRYVDYIRIDRSSGVGGPFGKALLREEDGWIYVSWDGYVGRIREEGLRLTAAAKASLSRVRGAARDASTGLLVLTGDDRFVEVFDPKRMASVGRWDLGIPKVGGVCAGGGTAWIGTYAGEFLQFDVATHTVTQRILVMAEQEKTPVVVDLSPSGTRLAAAATRRVGKHEFAAALQVYRVEPGRLVPLALARATLHSWINDLTVVERRDMVVLAMQNPTLVWRYDGRG